MGDTSFVFDMDGVLINSMEFHCKAWQQAARDFGVALSDEDIYLREGEKGSLSVKYFMNLNGFGASKELIQKFLAKKEYIFSKMPSPDVYPYIMEILEYLDNKNYRMALVTGTSLPELQKILPDKISRYFPIKITGDIVRHGKPDPEPYELALKKLGIPAPNAVVVENAPYGIRSAKGAGLFCLAVCTSLPEKHLHQADQIMGSAKELFDYIKSNY